jgi:hypothetical protein
MHLKLKLKGFVNVLVITFAVLLLALQISLFVSNLQVKRSFRWLFKKIASVKTEKA